MSFKICLIKTAIKWTPKSIVLWIANKILKGVAKLTDFVFDIEARKAYVQIKLLGESEFIEVWLEDFFVARNGEIYNLVIQQARSNRLWLDNLLSRVVGKAWKIPVMPQWADQIKLISELFKPER